MASLYEIRDVNDEIDYVEAESFQGAIDLWRDYKKEEWGEDFEETDLPKSSTLLSERGVVSRSSAIFWRDKKVAP